MRFSRLTIFSSVSRSSADLNDAETTPPDTNTYLPFNTIIPIDTSTVSTSQIYYFKTKDGDFGRLLLKRNPSNGTLLWGAAPDRYLTFALSYQSIRFNRFAKR